MKIGCVRGEYERRTTLGLFDNKLFGFDIMKIMQGRIFTFYDEWDCGE